MIEELLVATSFELPQIVIAYLDVESLLALQIVSKSALAALCDKVEARCKSECLATFLHPTMATYNMAATVPKSWNRLYLRFSRLREMEWTECKTEGTSSSLRSLKTDNQEYIADLGGNYLLRSGGHYWFSVLQTPLADITLSNPHESNESLQQHVDQLGVTESSAFVRSPLSINIVKWEKLRAGGLAPCPRRHHSMTCLPNASSSLSLFSTGSSETNPETKIPIRRIVFFGGQVEGVPFDAMNELHLLVVDARQKAVVPSKTLAEWVCPAASGEPPSKRCGHEATLLSNELVLISGGCNGTTPLPKCEVFLLHIEHDGEYGRFRWSTPRATSLPSGRAMHSVCRVTEDEVLIFGGRQIGQSNGLLDVQRLTLHHSGENSDNPWHAVWSEPVLSGCVPSNRRGHSTNVIGDKLVLIGGQDTASEELHCDVRVLDVRASHWRFPTLLSQVSPCPRRGFKTQYFGTSLVVSSGFVMDPKSCRVNQQLPDSDIFVLTPR